MLPIEQNPILEGIIIENKSTLQIIDISKTAKDILKIKEELSDIKSIFNNPNDFDRLHSEVDNLSDGIVHIKALDGQVIEAQYKISNIDENTTVITYIFKENIDNLNAIYKRLSDFFPGGIIVMDIDDNITVAYANTEAYNIIGVDNTTSDVEKYRYLRDFIFEEDKDWVTSEIHEILSKNKEVDIEFRVKTVNSSLKWVRLYGYIKDGTKDKKFFFASLKDLSMRRDINDGLHIERILFNKIAELTNEVIFRIDLKTNVVYFLGKKTSVLKGKTVLKNFPRSVFDLDFVYHEDLHLVTEIDEAFRNGIIKNFEVRKANDGGSVDWYKIVYSFVNNDHGQPLLVTGKFVNITEQKMLEEQAKTDLLTGFLNKITTELEVNKILNTENINQDISPNAGLQHAFFIIDIDFFKSINDNLGHHFGDIVLQEVANEISHCFRNNDIVGRIGGDEFVVLMTNICDERAIIERAKLLCKSLQKTYAGKDKNHSISASVGIAKFPNDGLTYKDLYQKADLSLYVTKENGKNGFSLYTEKLDTEERRQLSNFHNAERVSNETINPKVVETVFDLVYKSTNVEETLKNIFNYLSDCYDIDKIAFFQSFDDENTFTSNYLFEKDKAGFLEEQIVLIKELVDNTYEYLDEEGVFHTSNFTNVKNEKSRDIIEKINVKSCVTIDCSYDNDKKSFFILYDCTKERMWNNFEIKTLQTVVRMIFISLLKNK